MHSGRRKLWAVVLALIVTAWTAACGGDNEPSDAEQVRDVVANFQRQIGTPTGCSLLTPNEHQRRDRLAAGPCERTLPAGMRSTRVESVEILDHQAIVVLCNRRKIHLDKISLPRSENVSNPAQVWRITELPERSRPCPGFI
jgi:hypothetical protein